MTHVDEIIKRKKEGIDCTEIESAEIKGFVKERILLIGSSDIKTFEEIQMLFPNEYGEAIDEFDNNNY